MAKTTYTALQAEVRRDVRRIQQFIRRAEQRGYEFPQQIKDIKFSKKNATSRRLAQLKRWTSEKLYGKAKYASEKTYGEIISGKRGREIERQEAARKSAETRKKQREQSRQRQREYDYAEYGQDYFPKADIIDTVEQLLMDLPSTVYIKGKQVNVSDYKNPCIIIFYNQLQKRGRNDYAEYLRLVQDELFEAIDEVVYSDSDLELIKAQFTRIATLLKGSALNFDELTNIEDMYEELGF